MNKRNKGITLIALVVTIVVLLILAGTSIAMLAGDNGIITRAKQAKDATENAENEEQKQIQDIYDIANEKSEIQKIEDLEKNPDQYRHPDQKSDNKDSAIGTDDNPVNLDLWDYQLTYDGKGIWLVKDYTSSTCQAGYKNSNITSEGKIIGTVPKYIYVEPLGKVLPVTDMSGCFYNCTNLVEAPKIPDTIKSIQNIFCGCSSLTSITIPDSITSIKDRAFEDCSSLTSITIPDSVTSIEYCAFENCSSLTSITIPDSVTSIGNYAFYDCSSLTTVNYTGTEEQWNKISISSGGNSSLTNATKNYNYKKLIK